MAKEKYRVVGLGELLWDLFPEGRKLGGAPANFAYISSLLGDEGIAASRLGDDDLGAEARKRLAELGLNPDFVQRDAHHETGTVRVEVDSAGQPRFAISHPVAWDFLEWTEQWQKLAAMADAVCFGSLAQRSAKSRSCIRDFLQTTSPGAIRIFDVNLRQNFFSADVLADSMKLATVLKMNHEEVLRITQLFAVEHRDDESSARRLAAMFDLKLVCVTRGNAGSLLVSGEKSHSHPGFRVKVADTVGAGDAFTAALVHEYLRGATLSRMNEVANRVGSWVATEVGATPAIKAGALERTLANIA